MRILGIDPGLSITGYGCVEIGEPAAIPHNGPRRATGRKNGVAACRGSDHQIAQSPDHHISRSERPHSAVAQRERVQTAEPKLVEAGVFRLKSRQSLAFRLAQLHEDLTAVLNELQPQVMAVEKLFAAYRHPNTPVLMGHARGVVLLLAQLRSIELVELNATAVKKSITGNGHASKEQMQRSIMSQCRLLTLPEPPDVADAIGIALCAARRLMLERV